MVSLVLLRFSSGRIELRYWVFIEIRGDFGIWEGFMDDCLALV